MSQSRQPAGTPVVRPKVVERVKKKNYGGCKAAAAVYKQMRKMTEDDFRAGCDGIHSGTREPGTYAGYRSKVRQVAAFVNGLVDDKKYSFDEVLYNITTLEDPLCRLMNLRLESQLPVVVLQVPYHDDSITAFFSGHIHNAKRKLNEDDSNLYVFKKDTISNYISALKWFANAVAWALKFDNSKAPISRNLLTTFDNTRESYGRLEASMKAKGIMDIEEGVREFSFPEYQAIALDLLKNNTDPFAWAFLVVSWNLAHRPETISEIRLQHVGWRMDGLTIRVPKHKGDEAGDDCFPHRICANVYQPEVCPILAMAVLFISRYSTPRPNLNEFCDLQETQKKKKNEEEEDEGEEEEEEEGEEEREKKKKNCAKLFEGTNQKHRFSKNLDASVQRLWDVNARLFTGGKKTNQDVGVYSCRKGAQTYVEGFIDGPDPVAIRLRVGHSLGKVPDKYLFKQPATDAFFARVVCGLPLHDYNKFASLPPRFKQDPSTCKLQSLFPDYMQLPLTFRTCIPYFIARIVHSIDFLNASLPTDHPLRLSRVLQEPGFVDSLREHILLGRYSCEITSIRAQGVPMILQVQGAVVENSKDLKQAIEKIPENTLALIKVDSIEFGNPGATREDVEKLKAQFGTELAKLQVSLDKILGNQRHMHHQDNVAMDTGDGHYGRDDYAEFTWSGSEAKFLPKNFKFVPCSVGNLIDLWYRGHPNGLPLPDTPNNNRRTPPIRPFYLTRIDDYNSASKPCYSKAVFVMNKLVESTGIEQPEFVNCYRTNQVAFDMYLKIGLTKLLQGKKRGSHLKFSTVYNWYTTKETTIRNRAEKLRELRKETIASNTK